MAAAVAAGTWGLTCVGHMPKGAMFNIGTKSSTVAVGCVSACDTTVGSTVSDDGEVPQLHVRLAP